MWRELLNGPWPDQGDLPHDVRSRAAVRIRRYWRERIWIQIILGEAFLAFVAQWRGFEHPNAYLMPLVLVTCSYILGLFPQINLIWLITMVVLFAAHGMFIEGLGGVTAVSYMLPYTFGTMMLAGRRRMVVQACCVVAFWFSLLYDFRPLGMQLNPPPNMKVAYSILMAAATFQGLRFLNRLAIELNTTHTAQQVTQRSQQFLARVSHELRTPLNSVLGFAKMLRRTEMPPKQTDYLNQIIDEGEQLNKLVSDLLDSAQLSSGKLALTLDTCDVNTICQAVTEEIRALIKPMVALNVALSPDLPPINADEFRLRQIVRNLLGNAAKYTAQGEIMIKTMRHDSKIQIAVIDTGPGIPEDQRAMVFVPFVKLDNRSAGVGLGLDIARQLALLHGGDIRLESIVGHGSTFTLELPLASNTG